MHRAAGALSRATLLRANFLESRTHDGGPPGIALDGDFERPRQLELGMLLQGWPLSTSAPAGSPMR